MSFAATCRTEFALVWRQIHIVSLMFHGWKMREDVGDLRGWCVPNATGANQPSERRATSLCRRAQRELLRSVAYRRAHRWQPSWVSQSVSQWGREKLLDECTRTGNLPTSWRHRVVVRPVSLRRLYTRTVLSCLVKLTRSPKIAEKARTAS